MMAFRYEVVIEPPLSQLFREKFLQNTQETKCCELFHLITPDMPNVWEFRRDKGTFTLSYTEEEGEQKERIVIESDTLDLSDIIIAAIQNGITDYLVQFLLPLAKTSRAELESRIKARLESLKTALVP
jgi:hypothetical protein